MVLTKPHYTLNGLEFRPISPRDIQKIRIWRNSLIEVLRQTENISWLAQRRYFAKHVFNQFTSPKPDQILFGIFLEDVLLGYGGLVHLDWIKSHAEISFLLNPVVNETSDKYEELFLSFLEVIEYVAFVELKFDRITTETYEFRKKHLEILERFGMRLEGVLHNRIELKDLHFDSILHSKHKEERKHEN